MAGKRVKTLATMPTPSTNGHAGPTNRIGVPSSRAASALTRHVKKREIQGVAELVKRMREDEAFSFGESVIDELAKTVQVSVESDSDEPRAVALAESLEDTWYRSFSDMLEYWPFGRAAFERICKWDWSASIHVIKSLDYLPYELTEMKLCGGKFDGIKVGKGEDAVELTRDESWWLAYDATPLEPHGRSAFLGSPYAVWKLRRDHDKRETTWYKRFSVGRGVAYAPSEAERLPVSGQGDYGDLNAAGQLVNPMEAMKFSLLEVEAGGDLILPSSYDEAGNKRYSYEPAQDLKDGAALENRRRSLDVMALRSLGIPERAITQDSTTGSRAVADAHLRVLYGTIEGIVSQIVESFQRHIVDVMVRLNGFKGVKLTVNYRSLDDAAKARLDDIVKTVLISNQPSPLVVEGVVDFESMLMESGIPLGADATAALQRVASKAAPAAGPPGFGGGGFGGLSLGDEFRKACIERREGIKQLGGGDAS